jgi:protein gp37
MADSGSKWWHRSLNPFVGCQKHSEGCRLCWAERVASTRLLSHPSYRGVVTDKGWTGLVKQVPDGLRRVASVRKGLVFLCDMGDVFYGERPEVLRRFDRILRAIAAGARAGSTARFCLLTKRAAMMASVVHDLARSPGVSDDTKWALGRVWLGVSAENGDALAERVHHLYGLPCAGTFISAEPLLGSLRRGSGITLRQAIMAAPRPAACTCGAWHGFTRCPYTGGVAQQLHRKDVECSGFVREQGGGIDWVVTGAESGPGASPSDVEDFVEIVKDCADTCTPLFVKQLGARPYARRGAGGVEDRVVLPQHGQGGDMSGWPEELRVRQWPHRLIMEAKKWNRETT